jgi:hypothetical protein
MCKSARDGGQRCASHTREPAYQASLAFEKVLGDSKATSAKVDKARARWETATANYASTKEGQALVEEQITDAERAGLIDGDMGSTHLQQMLRRGQDLAAANRETKERLRAAPSANAVPSTPQPPADPTYRGHHGAPGPDFGTPMHDLEEFFPDIYDRSRQLRLYGQAGDRATDLESLAVINAMRDRPDTPVQVFRAVPPGVTTINPGDWVTTSRRYAQMHLDSNVDGTGSILALTVPAHEVWTNGDSIHEWGWQPGGETVTT